MRKNTILVGHVKRVDSYGAAVEVATRDGVDAPEERVRADYWTGEPMPLVYGVPLFPGIAVGDEVTIELDHDMTRFVAYCYDGKRIRL
jgi:hypothetical protein